MSNGARQDRRCGSFALLIDMMTPMTLAVTLEVERELEMRAHETDAARRQHVDGLRYDAELARRRYMKVDPDNRSSPIRLRRNGTTSCSVIPKLSRDANAQQAAGCDTQRGDRPTHSRSCRAAATTLERLARRLP